jgi:hypothetical protein
MYDLIRGIPESCRQVTRSMRGSCLEVPPQLVSHGVCQEIFEYSFFMNVSRNFFVKNLIIEANEVVLHDFSQICRLVHDIKHTLPYQFFMVRLSRAPNLPVSSSQKWQLVLRTLGASSVLSPAPSPPGKPLVSSRVRVRRSRRRVHGFICIN